MNPRMALSYTYPFLFICATLYPLYSACVEVASVLDGWLPFV